jgi:hypothetical protein
VEGEIATAAKFNTIRDDLLELDAVAGFNDVQYGVISLTGGNLSGDATITAVSSRAFIQHLGSSTNGVIEAASIRLTLSGATTVTATRGNSSADAVVSFCVVDPRG